MSRERGEPLITGLPAVSNCFAERIDMAFVTAARAGAPKMTPASTALLTALGSDAPDVGALEGVTILLVEDDQVSREALDFILTHYGACVTSTDSVNEALESFDRNPPSILVSDIGLPASDGYSLLRAIRTRESPLA